MELKPCESPTQQGFESWRGGGRLRGRFGPPASKHSLCLHRTWSLGRRCYTGVWELSWHLSPEETQRPFLARATSRGALQLLFEGNFLHYLMARDADSPEKVVTPPRSEQESYGFSCQHQERPCTTQGGKGETTPPVKSRRPHGQRGSSCQLGSHPPWIECRILGHPSSQH